MKKYFKILFLYRFYFPFLLLIIIYTDSTAQEFPLTEFMQFYMHAEKYCLKKYQVDTTMKSKKDFFKKLKTIDSNSYNNLISIMGLNRTDFPQEILITDINNDGNKEYFITDAYEGIYHVNYIETGNKYTKFLDTIPYFDFLINDPENIWLVAQPSYLVFDRFELERMRHFIYKYNFLKQIARYPITLYKAWEIPVGLPANVPYYEVQIPEKIQSPKYFILSKQSQIFADYNSHINYRRTGIASKGTTGWILGDTLNSYFVVLDSNTKYVYDSLGQSLITYKDKGFLMCWIRKDNVDFPLDNGITGTYNDNTTKEYLRFFETKNDINVSYFTQKTFENNLILVSFNKNENKLTVKFNGLPHTYQLEFKNNFKSLECINPDSTRQIFYRQ